MNKLFCIITFVFYTTVIYSQPGSLDLTYGGTGIVTTSLNSGNDQATSLVIQPDGKIVVAGYSYNGSNNDFAITRYNSNGTLDITFGIGGIVITPVGSYNDLIYAISIQVDGKIVVAGASYNGSNADIAIARYNSNGTLDNSFGTSGIITTSIGNFDDIAYSIAIQPDGKIIIGGKTKIVSNYDFLIIRYNSNGTLDSTFGNAGEVIFSSGIYDDIVIDLAIQTDDKIIAAGETYDTLSRDFAVIRINSNGLLDSTFGTSGVVITDLGYLYDDWVNAICIQNDGKILCAGNSSPGPSCSAAIVRYNSSGTIDTTFGKVITEISGSYASGIFSLAIQNNNKIVAAGFVMSGGPRLGMVRYNINGTIDNSFGTGGFVVTNISPATGVAIQNDGKIVCSCNDGSTTNFTSVRYYGDSTTFIENYTLNIKILIFPNPATDNLIIESPQRSTIEIINIQGQTMLQQLIQQGKTDIDISGFAKGVYILRLNNNDETKVTKILKE